MGPRVSADLLARLEIEHPIVQAPMGGGPTTPALVAAVSAAGGLGSIAGGYLQPEQIAAEIAEVRRRTSRPFAVNLFAGGATEGSDDTAPMLELLGRWHDLLGLPAPELPKSPPLSFHDQLDAVLGASVPVCSFTFGIPDAGSMAELKRRGVLVFGTATTVAEAIRLEEAGVDAVVAQGSEAGAHRGTFLGSFEAAMVGGLALIPQMVDAVGVPIIASGGIMDGRGIVAAEALGAAGVQMGTAFLFAEEAGTTAAYRQRLSTAREDETVVTRAFSGRPARGVRNAFIAEVEGSGTPIPPYPLQNSLTRALRSAAARAGDAEALSVWAGQGVRLGRTLPARVLVETLVREAMEVRRRLTREPPRNPPASEGGGPDVN